MVIVDNKKRTCYAIEFLRIACIGWCNARVVVKNNVISIPEGHFCAIWIFFMYYTLLEGEQENV